MLPPPEPSSPAPTPGSSALDVGPDQEVPTHLMVTRQRAGKHIASPNHLNLHVVALGMYSPVPKSVRGALKDPNWLEAMTVEYSTLITNNTWDLVRPPSHANIVSRKWIF